MRDLDGFAVGIAVLGLMFIVLGGGFLYGTYEMSESAPAHITFMRALMSLGVIGVGAYVTGAMVWFNWPR